MKTNEQERARLWRLAGGSVDRLWKYLDKHKWGRSKDERLMVDARSMQQIVSDALAEAVGGAEPCEQSGVSDKSRGEQFGAAHGWPSLRWSAELPKRPGWWWVRVPGMPMRAIEVESWHGSLNAYDGHQWHELNNVGNYWKGAEWAGPLPKPLEASDAEPTANDVAQRHGEEKL